MYIAIPRVPTVAATAGVDYRLLNETPKNTLLVPSTDQKNARALDDPISLHVCPPVLFSYLFICFIYLLLLFCIVLAPSPFFVRSSMYVCVCIHLPTCIRTTERWRRARVHLAARRT